MSDPTISQALEEAYASAPADRPLIHTLSIRYDGLVDDALDPTEIYIFQGFDGDRVSAEGVPLKDFRIEAGAAINGGAVVEFVAVPFDATMPNVTSQGLAKGKLRVDGVGREITDHLLAAMEAGVSIEVTYRAYIGGLEDDGPQNVPPIVFGLENVTATSSEISGDISLPNLGNKRFPAETFTTDRFPALT
jgi:hypothetical protein